MDSSSRKTIDKAAAAAQLAPHGVLRVAINLSNFLLVSGKDASGRWQGVAPDMAALLAAELGLELSLVPHATPSEIADAAQTGTWAVALIGNDPARAQKIAFSQPYVEIEASYLVPPGSTLKTADEVDAAGLKIASYRGSAYDLWLVRHLRHATLVHGAGFEEAFQLFRQGGIDAMASLRPKLLTDVQRWPGSRILPGRFMSVQQSMGVSSQHGEGAAFVDDFISRMKGTGVVAGLIEKNKAEGLTVALA